MRYLCAYYEVSHLIIPREVFLGNPDKIAPGISRTRPMVRAARDHRIIKAVRKTVVEGVDFLLGVAVSVEFDAEYFRFIVLNNRGQSPWKEKYAKLGFFEKIVTTQVC